MTTRLVVGRIDFNEPEVVRGLLAAVQSMTLGENRYRRISIKNGRYFEVQEGALPSQPGWYVLLADTIPVYVGQAENLNNRLNTSSGSLDNFANSGRKSDAERNFVKKFIEIGIMRTPRVWVMTAEELSQRLGINQPLKKVDLDNVEKFIDLQRGFISFK